MADTLGRVIIAPAELPVGILTALLGGPFFIYLVVQQKGQARYMTLRAEHCGLSYAGQRILHDVSLELKAGEILAVVGPNGAGKSSLVGLLAGTSRPTLGSVTLDNQLYADISLAARATRLAVLPQHTSLDFPFTVDEIIEMGRIPHGGNARMHAPMRAEIAALLGLEALRERVYTTLSGGEKQRTQIARVLCQLWDCLPASYFLFDEPTGALGYRAPIGLYESGASISAARGWGVDGDARY